MTSNAELSLITQLKKLGVIFEPPDKGEDAHGKYYVPNQKRCFSWAEGEDKPYPYMNAIWIPTLDQAIKWLEDHGLARLDILPHDRRYVLYMAFEDEEKYIEPDGETILEACLLGIHFLKLRE